MRKKLCSMLLSTVMVAALLSGCGSKKEEPAAEVPKQAEETQQEEVKQEEAEPATDASGKKDITGMTVAAVVAQEDQFSSFVSMGMQAAAKDYGLKCLTANTNNDQAKEVEYINTYLTTGVAGIAIQPLDEDTSLVNLKNASDKGMAVALEGPELTDDSFAVGGTTTAHEDLGGGTGKAAAEFIKNEMGGKANIGIICFDSQYPTPSNGRVEGFLQEVQAVNPDVVIVDRQDAWVQDMAVQVAGDMLTAHPEINVFFCANDGGTVGTVMAVKNAGLAGKCYVFGIDCGEQQINMLRADDNVLQAVTAQDAYGMGYKAMEALAKYLQGDTSHVGKTDYLEGTVLSRSDEKGINDYEELLKSAK